MDGWTHSGDVTFRVPLLPFATVERLDDPGPFLADPLVREAIAYASPDLAAALDRGNADPRPVAGYLARMSGRCTPFGLFTGTTEGTVEGTPSYELAGRDALRRRTTLPEADGLLRPNETAHIARGLLRYVERAGGLVHAATVEADEVLLGALGRARAGVTADDLARALAADLDVPVEDAAAYVAELVDAQVLVTDEPGRPSLESSRPATSLVLGDAVLREAYRAVQVLHPLARTTPIDDDLAAFRQAFAERYGDTEQPLLAVLDEETGIGFGGPPNVASLGAPLLAGLRLAGATGGAPWTPIDHHLVDLLSRAVRDGAREIDVAHELGPLRTPGVAPLPDTLTLVGSVAAASAEAVARGDFRLVVKEITGPGRDVAGVPERIPLAEVRVAVAGGRISLWWQDREVSRRWVATNPPSMLPLHRFLAAAGRDGVAGTLRWQWGAVQSAPFLPRVVVGRLVLARAQWWWFRNDLRPFADDEGAALRRLRDAWQVPRYVTLARGDHEIPLDLDTGIAARLIGREARRAGQLMLRECLPGPDDLVMTAPEGRFAHELALPLVRRTAKPAPRRTAVPARTYPPGSEWLAVRLEVGVATADAVLRDLVPGLVDGCDLWFYERGPGLRLRLHGDPATLLHRLPTLAEQVNDLTVETYRPGIVPEDVSHADSVAALRLLTDDLRGRWRAAFFGVDRLLTDAGLDDAEKQRTVREWRDRLVVDDGPAQSGQRAIRWAGRVWRRDRRLLAAPDPETGAVLDARSAAIAPLDRGLLDELCSQHVKRLLRAAHDTQQLVLFDLLDRAYRARLAY